MSMIAYRLRLLLESTEQDLDEGKLTTQMINNILLESRGYKEPAASDIRMVLGGLNV